MWCQMEVNGWLRLPLGLSLRQFSGEKMAWENGPFHLVPLGGGAYMWCHYRNKIIIPIENSTTWSGWDASGECRGEERGQVCLVSHGSNEYAAVFTSLYYNVSHLLSELTQAHTSLVQRLHTILKQVTPVFWWKFCLDLRQMHKI